MNQGQPDEQDATRTEDVCEPTTQEHEATSEVRVYALTVQVRAPAQAQIALDVRQRIATTVTSRISTWATPEPKIFQRAACPHLDGDRIPAGQSWHHLHSSLLLF